MNTEHTPGPWMIKWRDGGAKINPEDGHGFLADVRMRPTYTHNTEEYGANARLIAAAPDLLEALEGLLKNAPRPKSIRKDFSYTLYLEAAKTAIAKARGTE